jgi:multiple sugar transport system substrate-binding protein
MSIKSLSTCALFGAALLAGAPAVAQETLTVWWQKGFYKSEDDALLAAIKKFEAKNPKVKIELSLYAPQEMIPKTVAALDAGNVPDVAYGDVYDFQVTAKWAYDGKLEDVSSLLDPLRAKFEPAALSTTFLWNNAEQKRAYYAYPVKQQTMHIQYWKDMLAEAGFKDSDIPKDWKGYWSFWCDKVQAGYRKNSGNRAYGTGFPTGVDSSDSFYSFLTFMDAYNVKLVNDSGKLLVDDPAVRPGQQRRLPQQDDHPDPQRDDLDRRQVAR